MSVKKPVQTTLEPVTDVPLPFDPFKTGKHIEEIWSDLVAESDQTVGFDLAKDTLFDALEGVPFVITRATVRKGITRNDVRYDYISCEALVAPKNVLENRRINVIELPFDGGDLVVFNDGSTGIKRQVMAYLESKGRLLLPDGPPGGGFGDSRYDTPIEEWLDSQAANISFNKDGEPVAEFDIRLFCKRGLRLSEYQNDYNPSGSKTRYIA